MTTQGTGPWSASDYRNGSDIQSDQAYEARRSQEWITQSDAIQQRRMGEAAAPYREQQWIDQTDAIQRQRMASASADVAQENFRALERQYRQATDTGAVNRVSVSPGRRSASGAARGLTCETAAEIGRIGSREEGAALSARYINYSSQLRSIADKLSAAGNSASAATYTRMADGYVAASGEANRVSGAFKTYSAVSYPAGNAEPWRGGANWSMYGANAAGVDMSFRQGTVEGAERLTTLIAAAPVTVPLLGTGWGAAGAATLGGGTAPYQYMSGGDVNPYDVMDMGTLGAGVPALAKGAYSLGSLAWGAKLGSLAPDVSGNPFLADLSLSRGSPLGIGVPSVRATNPLSPVLDFDALGNEILYRSMSPAHFAKMQRTGMVPPTSETFVSPLEAYSRGYEGTLVRITTRPGTMDQLLGIGGTGNHATAQIFPEMERVSKGWNASQAQFKLEATGRPEINGGLGVVNTGLGKGAALSIFNRGIGKIEPLN